MVVTTLVILFLMTGSVILPIKSLLMNVLNLSAVFGLLVLIFQDGNLEGLLGYTSQGALEQTMPILLFAVAFGLSTDYAVFLLSRIKEARDNGASDSESVAHRAWSEPGASSPPRRSCSRSRSAPSRRRRSSSSRRTASARRSRC